MTNKPMLSVERELLDRVVDNRYREKENISIARHEALWELRALLDKPMEPSKFVGAAQYWSENEQALRDVCRFGGLKGLVYQVVRDRERTAAQHQGEPVAYRWRVVGLREWTFSDCSVEFDARANDERFVAQALYAEQPAPVAVDPEMLERFPEINFSNYGQDEVEALQAWSFEAYDAIARLNGVKP